MLWFLIRVPGDAGLEAQKVDEAMDGPDPKAALVSLLAQAA